MEVWRPLLLSNHSLLLFLYEVLRGLVPHTREEMEVCQAEAGTSHLYLDLRRHRTCLSMLSSQQHLCRLYFQHTRDCQRVHTAEGCMKSVGTVLYQTSEPITRQLMPALTIEVLVIILKRLFEETIGKTLTFSGGGRIYFTMRQGSSFECSERAWDFLLLRVFIQ